jgi:DNA-binding response OmpR family regulator
MSHTILLVDADDTTTTFLADQLSADDYRPVAAHRPATVYESAESLAPDLVILGDLAERHTALGLLDDIRSGARPFDPDLAVLVLSEHHTELDVLRAFEHGADDVVAKATGYPELRARIAALLRRRRHRGSGEVIRVRDLEIDARARMVLLAGEPVGLTQREFALLCHLATEPERVFTKRELIQELWGYPPECKTRTLDSHALRLRQKLGAHGDRSWVLSLWGVGYALTAPRDRARDRAAA